MNTKIGLRRAVIYLALVAMVVLIPLQLFAQGTSKDDQFPQRHREFFFIYRLYQDGLYDLAAEEFLEFARQNPGHDNSGEAFFLAGESLFKLGEYDQARTAYLRCAIEYPLDSRAVTAMAQVGACWDALGNPYKAADAYYRVYMEAPLSGQAPEMLYLAGKSYLKADSLGLARDMFETILDQFPEYTKTADVTLSLAEIAVRMGSREGATNILSTLLTSATADSVKERVLWQWFKMEHESDDRVAAMDIGERFRAEFPRSAHIPTLHRWLGKMALTADDAADAEVRFTEVLKADGADTEAKRLRAFARWQMGDWEGCSEDLEGDTDVAAQLLMGIGLMQQGDNEQARNALIGCLEHDWGGAYGLKALEQLSEMGVTLTTDECYRIPKIDELPDTFDRGLWLKYWIQIVPVEKVFLQWDAIDNLIEDRNSPYGDDLLHIRGLWYLRRGDWEAAREDFLLMSIRFRSSEWAMNASYLPGPLNYVGTPSEDRFEKLADLLARQSMNPYQVSSINIAWLYFEEFKNYDKAKVWFKRSLSSQEEKSKEANFGITLCELFQQRLDWWKRGKGSATEAVSLINDGLEKLQEMNLDTRLRVLRASLIRMYKVEFISGDIPLDPVIKWMVTPDDSSLTTPIFPAFLPLLVQYHMNWISTDIADTSDAHLQAALSLLEKPASMSPDTQLSRWYKWQSIQLQSEDFTKTQVLETLKELSREPGAYQMEAVLELVDHLGTPSERIPWLVLAKERVPYHKDYRRICLALGNQYFLEGRYQDALAVFTDISDAEAVQADPYLRFSLTDDDLEYKIGAVYRAMGQHEQALVHFRRYLRWHRYGPTAEAALYALGRTNEDMGYPNRALDYYRHLHRFFSGSDNDRLGLIRQGEILWEMEDYDDAAAAYRELTSQLPTADDVVHWEHRRIICLYRSAEITNADAAKSQFGKDHKSAPDFALLDAELDLETAKAMAKVNRKKDARKIFDRLSKRQDDNWIGARAGFELGKLDLTGDDPEGGLDVLTQLPTKFPGDPVLPEVFVTLGVFYYQAQQMENALQAFQNALAAVEGEPPILRDVLNNLVVVYRDLSLWEAALAALQRSISLYPDEDTVARRLEQGQFLMRVGEQDRAVEVLRKQIHRARGDELAAVQFYIGEAYFQKGLYGKAAAEFMKVKYLEVSSKLDWVVTAIYNAGQSYERMGKPEKAIELYEDIIRREGTGSPYGRGAQARIDELEQRENLLKDSP